MGHLTVTKRLSPLDGSVQLSGSKHSALHALAATFLSNGPVLLENCPAILDVINLASCFQQIGGHFEINGSLVRKTGTLSRHDGIITASERLRGSTLLFGSALARLGHLRLRTPGGDPFAGRDLMMFDVVISKFGGSLRMRDGLVHAELKLPIRGDREIDLRTLPHRRATGSNVSGVALMLAAANAGRTLLHGLPETTETALLTNFIRLIGARVDVSEGQATVESEGQSSLTSIPTHIIIPDDKIEIGFWGGLCAAVGGKINIAYTEASLNNGYSYDRILNAYRYYFDQLGIQVEIKGLDGFTINKVSQIKDGAKIVAKYTGQLAEIVDSVPHFLPALAMHGRDTSILDQHVGLNRFEFHKSMRSMGLLCRASEHGLHFDQPTRFQGGAITQAADARGAATHLIAALVADGQTTILNTEAFERVYQDLPRKLINQGASFIES